MADRLRTGTFVNNRFTTDLDVNDGVTYSLVRDTLKVTPPQPQQSVSQSDRRYGGGRVVGEIHGNGQVEADWLMTGVTPDQAAINSEALIANLNTASPGRYLEWRSEGMTRSVYYELRGPSPGWEPQYRWITWMQNRTLQMHGTFQTAPLAIGDPMDVNDAFAVDTRSDYTFDSASSADVAIAGGRMTPVVGASLATERRFAHSARGYSVSDSQVAIQFFVGNNISIKVGGTFRRTAANTYLEAYVDDNGTNSRMRVDKVVGGTRTNLRTVNLGIRFTTNTTYYLLVRAEGPAVVLSLYSTASPPRLLTTTGDIANDAHILAVADQAIFTPGLSGVSWIPADAAAYLEEVRIEPYTYKGALAGGLNGIYPNPQPVHMGGAIPGSAPALADVSFGVAIASNFPSFGLISWSPTNTRYNRVANGDFEDDLDGWASSGANLIGGSTLTRVITVSKFGTASMQVVGGAANHGASFSIYGAPFKAGVTYTASVYVRAASGTQPVLMGIIAAASSDQAVGTATNLSTAWQQLTVTWTPSADRSDVQFWVRLNSATAQTFTVDGVTVVEGTTLPTAYPQSEGRGAQPPFGPIEGESFDASDSTAMTIQSPSSMAALSDKVARWTPVSGSAGKASYYLDPSLVAPDTFSGTDLRLELWARIYFPSTMTRLAISASIKNAQSVGSERFTGEFGSQGKPIILPLTGNSSARLTRLGTLVVPADAASAGRWKLSLYFTAAALASGTVELDYVLLVPARQRAASPSGKPAGSGYPTLLPSAAGNKLIRSDLSGAIQANVASPFTTDNGLGGQLLELAPGLTDMLVFAYGAVPDDPTIDASSDHQNPHNDIPFHASITPRYFLTRGN